MKPFVYGMFLAVAVCAALGAGWHLSQQQLQAPHRLPAVAGEARPLANWNGVPNAGGGYDPHVERVTHLAPMAAIMAAGAANVLPDAAPGDLKIEFPDSDWPSINLAADANGKFPTFFLPRTKFDLTGQFTSQKKTTDDYLAIAKIDGDFLSTATLDEQGNFHFRSLNASDGRHELTIAAITRNSAVEASYNDLVVNTSLSVTIAVNGRPLRAERVDQSAIQYDLTPKDIHVDFTTAELIPATPNQTLRNLFRFQRIGPGGNVLETDLIKASGDTGISKRANSSRVTVHLRDDLEAGHYRLTIVGGETTGLMDAYGHLLVGNDPQGTGNYVLDIFKPVEGLAPTVTPGIVGATGPYVPYSEFTEPRDVPDGFNPHDKVESRVVRLYYYRDAHRVAQIINRRVQSYNRAGVDMQRQLADKAKIEADQQMLARQELEREAIRKAQESRRKEQELSNAEQQMQSAIRELSNFQRQGIPVNETDSEKKQREGVRDNLEAVVNNLGTRVDSLRNQVQHLREQEAESTEQWERAKAKEDLARATQFEREVAAAKADPDTYAPGVPTSDDPVEQVSVSVIGEGLIQLRGPIKGINIIRIMINEIDAPVGQVRIGVHTFQINGEREKRMEVVADKIQRQIDQSRFLTMQSAELLRRAVVEVASIRADEARGLYPGETQEDRDQRYLYAFFGKDFIHELQAMDSEFLRTGNKLLSLHSMDTTSLSSALNLMALANNNTRRMVLDRFTELTATALPLAEQGFIEQGVTCQPHCFMPFGQKKVCLLSDNARFESLRGFFAAEIAHDDTMTPLQREFLRLAQILKSRLVTEMEYKQRVMERAIIEERLGDRLGDLRKAKLADEEATKGLKVAESTLAATREDVLKTVTQLVAAIRREVSDVREAVVEFEKLNPTSYSVTRAQDRSEEESESLLTFLANDYWRIQQEPEKNKIYMQVNPLLPFQKEAIEWTVSDFEAVNGVSEFSYKIERKSIGGESVLQIVTTDGTNETTGQEKVLYDLFEAGVNAASQIKEQLAPFTAPSQLESSRNEADRILDQKLRKSLAKYVGMQGPNLKEPIDYIDIVRLDYVMRTYSDLVRQAEESTSEFERRGENLLICLSQAGGDLRRAYELWIGLRDDVRATVNAQGANLKAEFEKLAGPTDLSFSKALSAQFALDTKNREATDNRRPLDHKKLLDMLIDELEEKYVELLEGTRAHTANVDNYLKRLTTALDDDFNRQFYLPAFRGAREATVHWDVQFGQTESTTLLVNNRDLGKVQPGATMEFDLPERDYLLKEGLDAGLAAIDDAGALLNDPTFLALLKADSLGSPAMPGAGSTNGLGVVRDVLPGLQTSTSEKVLAQNANGRHQVGAALENLIPDPAIYKFETGTGFEIRPVIQPDGQAVVFDFHYMYTTNIREPVRADEKHLGRVKRHFIDTDVQLSNFELREVSRYVVALKAARTGQGVPLLQDIPVVGALWRPLPSDESSLQENIVMTQATIFPTLFDLMGIRWAPVVADLDPLRLVNEEFIVRSRHRAMENRVYDHSSERVDEHLRIPEPLRRPDLYRTQETIPYMHPNGYEGPGLDRQDSRMQEGYQPQQAYPQQRFAPPAVGEGSRLMPGRQREGGPERPQGSFPLQETLPAVREPQSIQDPGMRGGPQFPPLPPPAPVVPGYGGR